MLSGIHDSSINGLKISPNGELVASHNGEKLLVQDIAKDEIVYRAEVASGMWTPLFSNDSSLIIYPHENSKVLIVLLATGEIIKEISIISVYDMDISSDNRLLIADRGIVKVFENWELKVTINIQQVEYIRFFGQGFIVVVDRRNDSNGIIYYSISGEIISDFPTNFQHWFKPIPSPDNQSILTISTNDTMQLWDVHNGQHLKNC